MEYQDIIFWVVFAVFLAVFFGGIFYRVSIWLSGRDEDYYSAEEDVKSKPAKLKKYIGSFIKKVFSRDLKKIILIFFRDGIFHTNLFKDSKLKWFIHTFMFWGLVSFFLITIFHMIALTAAPMGMPAADSSWFIRVFGTLSNRFTAAALDLTKLGILFGVFLAVIRFLFLRKKKKSVELKDKSAGIFMAIIVIFGFLYEAGYIVSRSVPVSRAVFAPAGFILSVIFSFFKDSINFSALSPVFLYIYFIGLLIYIAYIPYGKFSHMVFGPFVTLLNRLDEGGS
jgi:heterodisulfide reductase subunit E